MTSIEQVATDVAERFEPLQVGRTASWGFNDRHNPAYLVVLDALREAESRGLVVFRDTSADFLFKGRQ